METIELYLFDCCYSSLHLLEKLVEWKQEVDELSEAIHKALHLLEKLVEWKTRSCPTDVGPRRSLFTCWRN